MMLQFSHRILLALAFLVALPALAQSDPPARVGRLGYIENEVDFRVDRNDQGGPATLNWPVSSGAVLETGGRGRAEVWIGSTAYRLADDSQLEFATVDDARVDVRLDGGSLAVSILDRDQVDDVAVATPDGSVRFLTPGRYRIDVFADHSELSVQAGRATFDDGQQVRPVAAGQKLSRWNDGSERLDADRNQDAFDLWVANRENATLAATARRHVSPQMTGYQDLDAYGDWRTEPEYGVVWYPRAVVDDWAPYRYGRWAWVAPWGWTWIDLAPWGFAPFHYGRWVIIHSRWCWVPGRLVPRPVYAPALVGWIGNPGWSVSFSFGSAPAVGWFPLAPREVYVPSYRYSPSYIRQINVTHVRDVAIIDRVIRAGPQTPFAHQRAPRAVTVVPANLMREGRPITAGEVRRHERLDLGRAPQARHAPSADWLAPAPAAARPFGEARREPLKRSPRRDFEATRPNAPERGVPRAEPLPRSTDRPAVRQPAPETTNGRDAAPRREVLRGSSEPRPGVENRGRPADVAPAPAPRPAESRPESEIRGRQPEAAPVPAPMRRERPMPEGRSEERQPRPMIQPPEREPRREMREVPRLERPVPRETEAPPVMRQREMPRPAPEIRAPAPPPMREMPQQRAEPPRQPAPQEGGRSESRRRQGHDDERGGR